MFASTLNIAHELRHLCEKDRYIDFRSCLKNFEGTYTILDNGISMGNVEFCANNRLHINKPRGTLHGEWRIMSRVMYDIGEKEEFEKRHAEWEKDSDDTSEPTPPTKEFIYVAYDEQRFYLFPIFKMHGIYGFVKFDTLPMEWLTPEEWLSHENECIFLVKKNHQGNYRLYDRDIPRTWDDAHTLTASILKAVRKERDIPHASLSIKAGCLSFVIAVIVGILTFMKASQAIYKPAIGSMLLDHGIGYATSEFIVSILHIPCLIIYIIAVLMLSRQALLPYTQRKMKEGLTSYYERYRSADSDMTRTYRLLQHRCYLNEEKRRGFLIPVSFTILFYATCFYALINYHNNPLWDNAEQARIEQAQKEQREAEQRQQKQEAAERKRREQQNAETRKKNAEREARKTKTTSSSTKSSGTKTPSIPTANPNTPPNFYPSDALPKTPINQVKHTRIPVNKTTLTGEQKANIQRLKAERDKAFIANDKARYAELTGEIARAGDTETQYNTATCYEAKNQFLEAIYWYQMAAATGHGLSLQSLAMIYEERKSMRNYTLARYYYEKAAEADIAYSHYRIGYYYENGIAGAKDLEKACEHYYVAAAAELQSAKDAYKRLSGEQSADYLQKIQPVTIYREPTTTPPTTTTRPKATTKPATKQTSTQGTTKKAAPTESSTSSDIMKPLRTIDINDNELIRPIKFRKASVSTNESETNFLRGKEYLKAKNYDEAFKALYSAAYDGHMNAQYELAKLYMDGAPGFKIDNRIALYWLRKAAEQQHPLALTRAAYIYLNDHKYKNDIVAFQCASMAASLNETSAYYYLANCYEYGIGTIKDLKSAAKYYYKANVRGIKDASSGFLRVNRKLQEANITITADDLK